MAVKVKPGVTFFFAPAMFRIVEVLKKLSKDLSRDLTITSGSDGVHSGPNDPHYTGNSLDIRTNDMSQEMKQLVLKLLLANLGPRFSGFIENAGRPGEHLHVQRLYGTVFTMDNFLEEPKCADAPHIQEQVTFTPEVLASGEPAPVPDPKEGA